MTIAQRAALVEKQRTDAYLRKQEEVRVQASAWDGLDSLGVPTSGSGKGSGGGRTAAKSPQIAQDEDDWGLGDFASAPSKPTPPPVSSSQSQSQTLWDLDEFTSPSSSTSKSTPKPSAPSLQIHEPAPSSPGDFDFGDREDRLLDNDLENGDEDDILGMLSKPVDQVAKQVSPVRIHHIT